MNIVGLMLIFSAVVFTAFKIADSRLYIVRELEEIRGFLKNLSHYISIYRVPVARAVAQIVEQNTYKSNFIVQLNRELESTNYFAEAYKNSAHLITYSKILNAIEPLADILGIREVNTQVVGIEQCCKTLDNMFEEVSEKYMSEALLYKKLGVLSAILVVIMIY